MARKEWELLFNLSAKQNSNFSSTFKAAQSALVETQNRIQQLNKVQSDITAYQKQQQAVDSTKQRLAVLQQQYDNIQKEIQETEGYSSALENKLISKQAQIDKTTTSLHTYEQRLAATGNTLREAGVDTTQLTAETTRLETEIDKLKDQQVDLKKTMDEAGEGAKGFGEKSVEALDAVESVLATAGIAKALGEIKDAYMDCINTAGDFEASMSNVEALSGASGDELEALSDKAKEMGASTKFTAGESADALSYMALAGWNTQSMLDGISPVLNLAAAANMDLAQASDIVTDNLTAFGLKASDTTHFVDVMAYAMAHSNTDVIQLGEAYKACASTATSLGYSVEETTAVLATMANAGVKGGEAGTALNAIFTRLATNTKKCGDELANYGVNIYDAQGNMQSLSSILTGIAGVWGDLTDQEQANLAKTIAGTNQYSKLQTIMAGCSEAAAEGGQSFSDYTEALRQHTDAYVADAKAQARQDYLNTLYEKYRDVLSESAENEVKLNAAKAKVEKSNAGMVTSYDKLLATLSMTDEQFKLTYGTVQDLPWRTMSEDVQQLRSEYLSYSADLVTARREVENYTEAMAQDQEAVDAAQTEYQEAAAAINGMADAQDSAADSAEDVAAALSAAQNNIQGIISAYNEAYDAALKSVSGQYDLWDTAEKIVATSASSINSALESQITYWDSYNQNLESLNARAADIDGLSAVIASFADGSKDSVNAIAGMASASDADLAKMVQNYQELQEAQKTTSESMADLETGMSNAMDEIAQNVADSVADMNLSDEAKESAQATIQGFVDGAEGMLPRVQTVFSKIASAASTALAGAGGSYSGNIPGYAVGTESAAPGFAIVGENGPELVYFNGGETVLTAPETRAAFDEAQQFTQIVSKNALDFAAIQQAAGLSENSMQTFYHDWTVYNEYEALTANTAASAEVVPASSFTHSEGSPISINFAPVYNFSGVSDTQQFESLLTSHDDDMREYILGVVEEAEHDKFRRAYA